MKRAEFVELLRDDNRAACRWLAAETFDTYDLEDFQKLWTDLHDGSIKIGPYCQQTDAVLLELADDTVEWDAEEESDA